MTLIANSKEDQTLARCIAHMRAVRENWASICWLKEALAKDDSLMFMEVWQELSHKTHQDLWTAPSKGGVWTTEERRIMREWGA